MFSRLFPYHSVGNRSPYSVPEYSLRLGGTSAAPPLTSRGRRPGGGRRHPRAEPHVYNARISYIRNTIDTCTCVAALCLLAHNEHLCVEHSFSLCNDMKCEVHYTQKYVSMHMLCDLGLCIHISHMHMSPASLLLSSNLRFKLHVSYVHHC